MGNGSKMLTCTTYALYLNITGIIAEGRISGVSHGRMHNRAVQYWIDGGILPEADG